MITLYSMQNSGNCYKPRLILAHTQTPFRIVDIDILKGESRTPEFLAKNSNGKVPLLELQNGKFLTESNAMLHYLAAGTPMLPDDRLCHAETLQWMFFEQYSHEPYIAVARFWLSLVKGGRELKADLIDDWMENGYRALSVMESHLRTNDFFAAGRFTIADIALYAYTHLAHEGGFDLSDYPLLRTWLARVASMPGHVDIHWRPPSYS